MKIAKQKIYENFLIDFLGKNEFAVAHDLGVAFRDKFPELSESNPRQIINRACLSGEIISSKPMTFGKGQFAYLPKGKFLDKEMILKIAKKYRPPLYRLISLIDINNGILSYYEGLKVASCPLKEDKTKQDSLDKLIKELQGLNLAMEVSNADGMKFIISQAAIKNKENLMTHHFIKMKLDAMFVQDIMKSLRKINIIDNIKFLYRNKVIPSKGAEQNNLVWDAFGYTRTTGINPGVAAKANTLEKQTMVALDIVVNRPYTQHDLQGFYQRIQILQSSVKSGQRKVIPIVVFREADASLTFNTLQKLGFLTFDLGTIYGSRIFQIIDKLKLVKLSELGLSDDPSALISKIDDLLASIKMAGQDENLQNLKGDLFESLMYPLIKYKLGNYSLEQGGKLKSNENGEKKEFEYDYFATGSEKVVIELKGYKSDFIFPLGNHEARYTVNWFWGNAFPFAQKYFKERDKEMKVTGCFITTGSFTAEAVEFLKKIDQGDLKPKYFSSCWYDGKKLLELVNEMGDKHLEKVLKRYFIKTDLSDDEDATLTNLNTFSQRTDIDNVLDQIRS